MLCVQVPMHVGLDYRRHVCLDSFLEPPRSCSCSGCSHFHLFGIASEKQACLLFLFEIKSVSPMSSESGRKRGKK